MPTNLSSSKFVDMTGQELKELRKKYNFTQKELGNKIGVSDTKISQWENNVHKISNAYVLHLTTLFERLEQNS